MKSRPVLAVLGVICLALAVVGVAVTAYAASGDHKTSICHRTASDSNPYVFITVDDHSLQAHLSNGKGHFPTVWKSAGTWRGVSHAAGDLKNDYVAGSSDECRNTTPTETTTPPPTDLPTTPAPTTPVPTTPVPPTPPTTQPSGTSPEHQFGPPRQSGKPHHPQVILPTTIEAGL